MNRPPAGTRGRARALGRLLGELRPKLRRYCARTTGSVVSGEGVLQHRPQPPQESVFKVMKDERSVARAA